MMAHKGNYIIAHLIMICLKKSILSSPTFKKYLAFSLLYTWNEFTYQFTCNPMKINCIILLTKCIGNNILKLKPKTPKLKYIYYGQSNHKVKNYYHVLKPKCTLYKKLGHNSEQ